MAATTIGDLAVRIGADTTGLVKGLSDSSKRIDQFAGKVRKSTNDFGKYAAAATAAGVALGTVLVKQQLKAIDSLAKTSDKLGVTTEALTSLRFAAELTGVASNTLDMALQRMTRRVAEAAMDTGEAKDAIKQLGLSAQELAALSPDKAFQKIAGAMENVGTQGEKVRLAFKLFDSEGVALVNTLALGEQGLKDMAAEADRLGVSISRIEAAQVEAANDALTRAGAVMEGALRRATVDLAPVIEAVANEFVNAAAQTNNFGTAAIDTVQAILTPIGILMDGIHGVRVAVKGLEATFVGLGFGAISSWNMIVKGYTELANLIPGIDVDFKETFLGKLEQSAADATAAAVNELHELAMTKLPSHEIDDWLGRVRTASEKAAQAIAENRAAIAGGGSEIEGGGMMTGADRDKMQARLDAVRDQFKSEQQLLSDKVAADHQTLVDALEAELITKEEYFQRELQLKQLHEEELTKLEQKASEARRLIADAEAQARTRATHQMFTDLASLMNTGSRKMFEVGKAAAISQTVLSTYEGAQKAYTAMAGIPVIGPALGAAAAAAAIASGVARVQAINSTSFGSKSVGGGGSFSAPSAGATSAQGGAAESRVVSIQGLDRGSLFSGDQVRDLIERINEAQEDGTAIVRFS